MRVASQIRSHAQKHFLKLQKQGDANIPPPRPKRKPAVAPAVTQSPAGAPDAGGRRGTRAGRRGTGAQTVRTAPRSCLRRGPTFHDAASLRATSRVTGAPGLASVQPPGLVQPLVAVFQGGVPTLTGPPSGSGLPDFTNIYHFLARLVDPDHGHAPGEALATLRGMPALEQETALLLMSNLARNLMSRSMWDEQMRSVCEGKPTFVTAEVPTRLALGLHNPAAPAAQARHTAAAPPPAPGASTQPAGSARAGSAAAAAAPDHWGAAQQQQGGNEEAAREEGRPAGFDGMQVDHAATADGVGGAAAGWQGGGSADPWVGGAFCAPLAPGAGDAGAEGGAGPQMRAAAVGGNRGKQQQHRHHHQHRHHGQPPAVTNGGRGVTAESANAPGSAAQE